MLIIKIKVGTNKEQADSLLNILNKSLVGSACFKTDEVLIPDYIYEEENDKNIIYQEIIIGENNDDNITLYMNIEDIISQDIQNHQE